jgi:pimeloyl-ACP methyl ester carboxylesterase
MPPTLTPVSFDGAGVRLAGDARGEEGAPIVILLHGGGQTRHSWHGTADRLAEAGWRALTIDLRGHGDSEWSPDGTYSGQRFGDDVSALVAQQPSRPALVGASLGGISSLIAAGAHPDSVAGLVVVDVAIRIEQEGAMKIGNFMRSGMDGFASLDEAAEAIAAYNPNRPRPQSLEGLKKNLRLRDGRWHWHWDPQFITPMNDQPAVDGLRRSRLTSEAQLSDAARRVTCPTLLVRGRSSDILSVEGAEHFLSLVPHAEFVDVEGAGHMVAGDRNDTFSDAVIEFLDRKVRALATT